MLKRCLVIVLALLTVSPALAHDKFARRIEKAKAVYEELLSMPDHEVPEALLSKCQCIVVMPGVIKGALGWGGRHGRGVVSCRNGQGSWSPPSFINVTGGSFGFQIGVKRTDVVLFIMTDRGARSLVGSEFTLGGDAAVAAGPVGRSAEGSTDIKLGAAIYSYAKAKGLFAGISLNGARLNSADKAIREYYGKPIHPETILFEHQVPKLPAEAREFISALP